MTNDVPLGAFLSSFASSTPTVLPRSGTFGEFTQSTQGAAFDFELVVNGSAVALPYTARALDAVAVRFVTTFGPSGGPSPFAQVALTFR